MTDYDQDEGAMAWARGKIAWELERAARFAAEATDPSDEAFWQRYAVTLADRFIGGDGYALGVFDERLPGLWPTGRKP